MNTPRDPKTILAAWLDEGPRDLPDATRRAILTALPTTPQARRGLLAPWRFMHMNTFARGASVVVVAVVAVGALALLSRYAGIGLPGASPSPSPAVFDSCLVGTWTTTPLTRDSPYDNDSATYSGGAGQVFTIDATGNVTIDTHAMEKVVFVVGNQTFTATYSGTGRGTLSTLTTGPIHYFQYLPSSDTTLTTSVVGSQDGQLPTKDDLPFTAVYTCVPGQALTFYKELGGAVQYMIDGAFVTLSAGTGSSSPGQSPNPS
jgi:hypothetical protein